MFVCQGTNMYIRIVILAKLQLVFDIEFTDKHENIDRSLTVVIHIRMQIYLIKCLMSDDEFSKLCKHVT